MTDLQEAGFKQRTRIADARERLLDIPPIDRTERISLSVADGRTVAEPIEAVRNVPHYARAAMDGWALRAEDTFGASDRSPAILRTADEAGPGRAVRVHTGSELPERADAVVMIEDTDRIDDEIEVFDAVAAGENVAPIGEDVEAGQQLYDPGHRLRPSDLGLLKGTGIDTVETVEAPEVAVIPTGEELVQADPDPGEVVETNRFTISRLAERWGADVTRREIVTDDHEDKPNPHGITVGKIGALASSDYNPESDTHSRYTDGEASNAAPVQSVNGATGNVSLETGVDATLVSSGKVDTFTKVAVVGSHSGQRTIPYAIELFNPDSGNELTTVFDVGSNGDTSATYLTTVSPAGAENEHRYAVFELTL